MDGQRSTTRHVPAPTSPIIGRGPLTEEATNRVLANRVVTLTGAGGVGKTRTAIEVAHRLADLFADGVVMVELAPLGDAGAVPEAIADALGITPNGDRPVIDTVADGTAGRQLLLVLDNCEHVVDGARRAIAQIVGRSTTTKVLATSRESLRIAGEQRVSVPPLDLEGGVESEAVTLFVERAHAVRPGFGTDDPATADAVEEICRTLDGLPLAIELAAARMASMTAIELRDRLEHRFRLLTGAAHRPERQRTLEQTVAWSYELLDDSERDLLRTAAVFAGGFDLACLVDLFDDMDEIDALAGIDALVNRSLVVANHRNGATRYHLLETIRHFASNRVAEGGGLDELRDRHAALFARQAVAMWEQWNGPGWRRASDWIAVELANLRAGYMWSVQQGRVDVATDIAAHAALLGTTAQKFEPVAWAEELMDAATKADVARLPRLCTGAGYACFVGRPVSAAAHAHAATELERDPRYDPCDPGLASFVEALASVYSGDLDRYVALSEHVAGLAGRARAFGLPAFVDGLQASGRVEEALELVDESIAVAREVGNPFWIAYALWTAGLAHANVDPTRALAAWDEGVNVVHEHGVEFFAGFLARDAARVHTTHGDPEAALDLFATAVESFRQAGNIAQLIITVALVPHLFDRLGRHEAAATLSAAVLRQPASVEHVPDLPALGERLRVAVGDDAFERYTDAGVALDLNSAASYAVAELRLARDDLARARASEPPGGLSRREVEVLRLVADGLTTRELAERLFISPKTADHHIQHIYTKTGVSNRAAATRWAIEHDLVSGEVG